MKLRSILLAAVGGLALAAPASEPCSTSTLSRIAFGACLRQDRLQPIWEAVAAAQPELFVLITRGW